MKKYLVETYYTCTFKTVHTLSNLDDAELSKIDQRTDGNVEVIDVKLNNRKTKKIGSNKWVAYYDNGREKTEKNVFDWTKEVQDRGSGEILITSIDKEGTKSGFDLELCEEISSISEIPVIYSGGMKSKKDLENFKEYSECDGIAVASILHYNETTINEIKKFAEDISVKVRV